MLYICISMCIVCLFLLSYHLPVSTTEKYKKERKKLKKPLQITIFLSHPCECLLNIILKSISFLNIRLKLLFQRSESDYTCLQTQPKAM